MTQLNKQTLFTFIFVFAGGLTVTAKADAMPGKRLANPPTWCVNYGPSEKRRRMVISDAETFQAAWKAANSHGWPAPALPSVDFDHTQVVALYRGGQNSGGYGIAINALAQFDNEVRVYVRETSPQPGSITISSLTSPVCFAAVPKTGAVSFVDDNF